MAFLVRSLRSPVARGSLRSLISLRAVPVGLCARRRRSLVRHSVVRPSVLGRGVGRFFGRPARLARFRGGFAPAPFGRSLTPASASL